MDVSLIALTLSFLCQMPQRCTSEGDEQSSAEDFNNMAGEDNIGLPSLDRFGLGKNPEYEAELKAGDIADMFGTNAHRSYPTEYRDFSRRFVPVYPYKEVPKKKNDDETLLPVKANPDKVLAVALKSALEQTSTPIYESEAAKKEGEILRTGDYWNAVWVEQVNPKKVLRTYTKNKLKKERLKKYKSPQPKLGSVIAKIMPGSKLYQLVSILQQFSPRLLYVVNNDK